MQKINNLKKIIFIYTVIQLSFMIFYTPITGSFDLFPLFTWNIFRPYPDTPIWHHVILVKKINDVVVEPAREIIDLPQKSFRNISFYNYTHRIQLWGDAFKLNDESQIKKFKNEFDADFLVFNENLEYQLKKIKIHPIEYKTKKEVIESVTLGEWRIERNAKIEK